MSPENYHDSCKIVFERLVAQNCVYIEASFHLSVAENLSVPFREVAGAIHAASPPEVEFRLFLGMFRDHYQGQLAGLLDEAITWDEIAGVDLHGFEHPAFRRWSAEVWSRVRSLGKKRTPASFLLPKTFDRQSSIWVCEEFSTVCERLMIRQ